MTGTVVERKRQVAERIGARGMESRLMEVENKGQKVKKKGYVLFLKGRHKKKKTSSVK